MVRSELFLETIRSDGKLWNSHDTSIGNVYADLFGLRQNALCRRSNAVHGVKFKMDKFHMIRVPEIRESFLRLVKVASSEEELDASSGESSSSFDTDARRDTCDYSCLAD
ncbi:hypothetical protein HG530_012249 [Fusarium avenaceum]|nr:hypothetical protein HG530_012249 [Fusarium avenaceum]